uniref:Uncharacterized protein n=1 Tax=Magallana gigas TaxID=29159 RepID=A0A8W8ITT6_MAGGI
MVFNGTDSVSREQTTGALRGGAPHYTVENLDLMFIGSNFFYLHRGYNNITINLTDFTTTSAPPTTESPLAQEDGKDKINFILQFKDAQDPTLQVFI